MRKLIKESGIRDINQLAKRYLKAEIYFHQDLDGVTTAIAMKKYLEDNGIKVVDAHVIRHDPGVPANKAICWWVQSERKQQGEHSL